MIEAVALLVFIGGLFAGFNALDRWHQRYAMRCAIQQALAEARFRAALKRHCEGGSREG